MKEKCKLDMVPQMVNDGKLTAKEAAVRVLEELYTNPGRFNLLDMSEDERSDFLTVNFPKFERLVERYNKKLGPLGAYIFYSLPGIRICWAKKKRDEATVRQAAKRSLRNLYEIERLESMTAPADKSSDKEKFLLKVMDAGAKKDDDPLFFRQVFGRRTNFLEPKSVFYKKRAALVLALKSAWYLDDDSVAKISEYCGFSFESVFKMVKEIKENLAERSKQRADIEARRDKSWYFVCKYREQLARMDPSGERYRHTKKKLEYQLNSWKNKTQILQSGQMTLAPKNKYLSKILKIDPAKISMLLNYAKKMVAAGETLFPVQP